MAGLVPAIHACNAQSMRGAWVYIITNKPNGILYIGVTSNLPRRGADGASFDGNCRKATSVPGLVHTVSCAARVQVVVRLMIEDNRITLIIEGLPEDEGRVRFGAFLSGLQSLSATINRLDRNANAGKPASYFRIAELSYSSPARVVIEPHALPGQPPTGHLVVESLNRIADAFATGGDLYEIDAELLEDIRSLARPVGTQVKYAALLFDGNQIDLTPQVARRAEAALAVDEECEGSIEGMLEQINIHLGANTFHIYPEVGPKKVTCHFPARLYDDAVSAVGRRVQVSGTLRYRARASFPHQVAVTHIDTYPPDSELPDWDDLRGRAPDATGGLSSEEFVRELRNGWR